MDIDSSSVTFNLIVDFGVFPLQNIYFLELGIFAHLMIIGISSRISNNVCIV
jgi:hypothetical protein